MRTWFVPLLLMTCVVAVALADDEKTPADATRLLERPHEVQLDAIETLESAPPQFALKLEVAMPEPGWTLAVDSVSKPDEAGRIAVRIVGTRPDGMLPQVITMTPVRVALGSLPVGRYLVEVWLAKRGAYALAGTVMLDARR